MLQPDDNASPSMRPFQEYVTAIIAAVVIVTAIILIFQAFRFVDSFERAKDLLLFINPILGIVIGYYFNKVSTEARAENAETAAKSATTAAQQASEARDRAEAGMKAVQGELAETHTALEGLHQAAENMLSQAAAQGVEVPEGAVESMSVPAGGQPVADDSAERELRWALKQARKRIRERRVWASSESSDT